jgi:phage terminase large subunit GpA-like protein
MISVNSLLGRPFVRIPKKLPIVPFIEKHRKLSQRYSAKTGPIDLSLTPYATPILLAMEDLGIDMVTLLQASQTVKTTSLENGLFHAICERGVPCMFVVPDAKARNVLVEERLKPTIESSPRFAEELMPGKTAITQARIKFVNGSLYLALAESESDLASRSVGLVVLDEIDKYPDKTTKEGSPIDQARKRIRTFPGGKVLQSSTPTSKGGAIWQQWTDSDQRGWHVPCPSCGELHQWKTSDVQADPKPEEMSTAQWIRLIDGGDLEAWWQCPSCSHKAFTKGEQLAMNRAGEFISANPGGRHAGFHVPALASPFWSFRQHKVEYERAALALLDGDDSKMKDFTIHQEGIPYDPPSKRSEVDAIISKAINLPFSKFPAWVDFITIGADVQHDGTFYVVTGWGRQGSRFHVGLWGKTADYIGADYDELDLLLGKLFEIQGGQPVKASVMFIDSGDGNTQADVYRFANRHERVFPIKGASVDTAKFVAPSKGREHLDKLRIINTSRMKDILANQFERDGDEESAQPAPSFAIEVLDDIHFKRQLVSEERRVDSKSKGAKPKLSWFARPGYKANHYWDCMVYATAAATMLDLYTQVTKKKKNQIQIKGRYQP